MPFLKEALSKLDYYGDHFWEEFFFSCYNLRRYYPLESGWAEKSKCWPTRQKKIVEKQSGVISWADLHELATVCVGLGIQESCLVLLFLLHPPVQQRELDLVAQELLDMRPQDLRGLQGCCSNDVNVQVSCVMATSHVHVHLVHRSAQANVTVLLRYVHHSCLALITQQNGIVLDRVGVLLKDTFHLENLIKRKGKKCKFWNKRTCPWHFFTLFCVFINFQNLDLATTGFLEKTVILKIFGFGSFSEG